MTEIISLSTWKFKNIQDVIDKMEAYKRLFSKSEKYHHLRSFLEVYLLVTKTIQNYCSRNEFENIPAMEQLDIRFANLYFDPLEKYLDGKKIPKPWQTYFSAVEKKADPFVLMLLGINAHINSDLLQVLIEKKYDELHDFEKVNEVLLAVVPRIMEYLAFNEKDIWGIGGLVFSDFAKYEFQKIIVKWRELTWKNYKKIITKQNHLKVLPEIHNSTEKLAQDILFEFREIEKLKNIRKNFVNLNSLSVNV